MNHSTASGDPVNSLNKHFDSFRELEKVSDIYEKIKVNVDIMRKVNPKGLCVGYDNTLAEQESKFLELKVLLKINN